MRGLERIQRQYEATVDWIARQQYRVEEIRCGRWPTAVRAEVWKFYDAAPTGGTP